MNNKIITFNGIRSGDGECFCWLVTGEEYRKVVGDEAYQLELDDLKDMKESLEKLDINVPNRELFRLYPGDIFPSSDGEQTVTISVGYK